jgi:hypothetical protein
MKIWENVAMTAKVEAGSRKRASNPARGSKPGERRGGRKKGTPNKITQTFKQAIETAFENVGGAKYLEQMAVLQPVAFMGLIGKVLPTQIEHSSPDGTMTPPTTIRIVAAE